jgi:transposase InsO family protein
VNTRLRHALRGGSGHLAQTTDSGHDLEIAINLARRMTPTAINQLWVADITYVRLGRVDVFLAVVMDAFSRKIVGWNLAPKLTTEMALTALKNAIDSRKPAPGLIHHSDRGVQYASVAYVDTLLQHGMIPSMSRPGNPYDKAYASHCTSFAHCATTGFMETLFENLTPWAFRGGLSPGCSYKQSFLPL